MSPWVKAKALLGAIGLGAGLAGMALDAQVLIWVAIGALGAAFLVRFVERRTSGTGANQSSTRE